MNELAKISEAGEIVKIDWECDICGCRIKATVDSRTMDPCPPYFCDYCELLLSDSNDEELKFYGQHNYYPEEEFER